MKKRLLASLMCLCLLVGLLPATALAAGVTDCPNGEACNHEAAIEGTHYDTLKEAMGAAKNGETVDLLRNVTLTKSVETAGKVSGITLDLNGHNIDGTAVTSSNGVVWMGTKYGWKPVEGTDNTMKIINSVSDQGGEIKGTLPVQFGTGDSRYPIPGEIGEGVTLTVTGDGTDAVQLKSSAYLVYSETSKDYIKNGGFKVNAADGTERIYGSYANAAGVARNGVVTMLHDYSGKEAINSGNRVGVLDLGGNTFTYLNPDKIIDINYDNAGITIQNGTLTANAEVLSEGGITALYDNTTLVLECVTMNVPGNSYGIVTNGTNTGNTITLKDSTLNVPDGYGIYFPSSGSVAIEDSVINAKYSGVQMCSGSLTVKGDKTEITTTGEPQPKTENDGPIADGAAISVINRSYPGGTPTMSITGGTFSSENTDAVKAYTFSNTDKTEGEWEGVKEFVSISGGTFSSDVTDYLDDGCELDETGSVVPSNDSVASIEGKGYASLDAAITAAQNGDTITILKAAADENGYKLNDRLTYSGKAITIKAASGVDVKFNMSTGAALHGAKITFEGVTFEYKTNNNYIGLQHTDTMVYNNCVFNGQMFLYGASETFNGCTFHQDSADTYNVWTYGAKEVEFNDCTFNCAGKSVLVYNEGSNSGTDLTVTDTTFRASQPVEGKAAIEIDTSLMKGQTKISVDQATADKITGFGVGSNSGSSLWNDKKNNAQSENIAVTVAGEVVLEPQVIDFDAFIKRVEASEYTFDGTLANGKKLTVKWSPESGCLGNNCGQTHEGIEHNSAASNRNVPNKVNSSLAQFYLANNGESPKDVDVKLSNVNFVYEAKDFTLYGNTNWKGEYKADDVRSAQLYLMNSKDTLIENCTFDHVVFTSFNNSNGSTTIKNSEFKNIYNSYAIKDLVGKNGIEVSGCTFENCGGGIMIGHDNDNNDPVSQVTIKDNTFKNIDVAGEWTAEGKAGTRGMIQIAKGGDYTNASIILDGNTATNCGPILRQLNQGIADNDVLKNNLKGDLTGLGGKLTYTSDSVKKTDGNEPAQPTVYTVKFENADVAEMKVIEGTEIALPTPGNRPNYKFEGWYVGSTKVGSAYKVTGDVTFVAKWDYIDEDGGSSSDNERTYAIITEDNGHGSVTVSADEASAGTRITVTVKPDAGYELDELTVTDAKNKDLKVTKRSETTYTFHMADSKVTVEASFTKDGTVQKPDTRFDDVAKSAWYYKAVEYVAENGIMSGVSAREFAPNAGFSRAMLAQTLYAMSGKPTVKAEGTFADVAANAWYADAVNWAAEKGYVSGVGDGKFAPDASITREQMALILYRYAGSPDASGMVLREFADGDSVSAYAVDAIRWAVHEGLISGMENNTLAPQGTATRAQVAQILMNFHQKLDK